MKRISSLSFLVALAGFSAVAVAQQYPTRNISMVVPYAAGGAGGESRERNQRRQD